MVGVRPRSTSADPGPNPAKRPRLQLDQPAQQDLEEPMQPSSDWLTSLVFLASGSALQLHLDGFDLLLQPHSTSILQVLLPGHTILLVPEQLQTSPWPGHPDFSPTNPLGSDILDMPRDRIVIQPGSFNDSGQVPDGPSPPVSPGAERYDPWATQSRQSSMPGPLPDSPLQPVSPSPPPSHQEQRPLSPVRPPRPPCKAKRRLRF